MRRAAPAEILRDRKLNASVNRALETGQFHVQARATISARIGPSPTGSDNAILYL
jgi:hypothetical protein